MTLTVEIDPARRTAAFREVSFLAAGDSCRVVLDGVRGADFGSLALLLYRDAASESPVASCSSFSRVPNHPSLADGELALDTAEMAAWFGDAVPGGSDDSDDSDDAAPAPASAEPRLAARASLAERSVRADGWLVVLDRDRTWAACRVPVLLRPGAGASGVADPTSVRALVEGLVSAALSGKADKAAPSASGNLASLDPSGNLADSGATPESIKAAAVAEVVANAPGTMDTLKEIADILGSAQQSGTVLKRISDLESGKRGVGDFGVRADPLTNKADITFKHGNDVYVYNYYDDDHTWSAGSSWIGEYALIYYSVGTYYITNYSTGVPFTLTAPDYRTKVTIDGTEYEVYAVVDALARRSQVPTKTSQLVNDGDGAHAFMTTDGLRYDLVSVQSPGASVQLRDRASTSVRIAPVAAVADQWTWDDGGSREDPYYDDDNGVWRHASLGYASDYADDPADSDSTYLAWLVQDTVERAFTVESVYYDDELEEWALELADAETGEISYAYDFNGVGAVFYGVYDEMNDVFYSVPPASGEVLFSSLTPGSSIVLEAVVEDYYYAERSTSYAISSPVPSFTAPPAVPGKARDFVLDLEVDDSALEGTDLEMPAISFSPGTGGAFLTDDGDFPAPEVGRNLYSFTEVAQNAFAVSRRMVEAVS